MTNNKNIDLWTEQLAFWFMNKFSIEFRNNMDKLISDRRLS